MKTEVYSWRVDPHLKARLDQEAKRRNVSVASLLTSATEEYLAKTETEETYEQRQARLRAALSPFIGAIQGGDPDRSQNVSKRMRAGLRQRHER